MGSGLVKMADAHEHHGENIPEGEAISAEPLDTILWLHIALQTLAFGLIFPTGMVLGIVHNRFHVPVQILGTCIAIVGYFLGHLHGGREFAYTAHAGFANYLMLMLLSQVVMGAYLKLHLEKGLHARIRTGVKMGHSILGKTMPILSWLQLLLGGIAALGFCRGEHTGQCLAHFIMGSAFIGYGIIMLLMLLVGQEWLRRKGRSQEFFDSAVIAAWGAVNTFTEHRWGEDWRANDVQHTVMGVVWWAAGLCGVWLSLGGRNGGTRMGKRNFVPGFVIFLTGWAMSGHPQHLMLSTMVHTFFGYSLMAAGLTRIIEVAFVLHDKPTTDSGEPSSFQFIPPFLLIASGFLFLGATEEQMALLTSYNVTHVAYILVLYSFAFLMYLFANVLLHIYASNSAPTVPVKSLEDAEEVNGNGWRERRRMDEHLRDAEEFELGALLSDEEGGGRGSREVRRSGEETPSTLGKNSVGRV